MEKKQEQHIVKVEVVYYDPRSSDMEITGKFEIVKTREPKPRKRTVPKYLVSQAKADGENLKPLKIKGLPGSPEDFFFSERTSTYYRFQARKEDLVEIDEMEIDISGAVFSERL